MKKTIAAMLVVCLLAVPAFAGGKSESKTPETKANLEGYPILDEPTTFTIFSNFDNIVFDSNWAVFKNAGDLTNVYLDSMISLTNSNEQEAFNLMVASGKLADVICFVNGNELDNLGRNGGLLPLNDLIDKYAPNIKKALEENTQFAKDAYSLDGNIYYIPKTQTLKFTEFYWIRKDWLDKLGLEVPTTTDELHDVLLAFRNEDPNGNGLKDEIPLFDRRGDKSSDEYLQMFNSSTEFNVKDGKVVYDPLEPEFETAVKELAKWYAEGIIDPEIFTRGSKSRDVLLASNQGGFTHDWVSTADYKVKLEGEIPGFEMMAIAPPVSPYGTQILRDQRSGVPGWGISSQCKDPIAVIRYFDYFFTPEGNTAINWGVEGETFAYDENGDKYFLDNIMHTDTTPLMELRKYGVQYRIGMIHDGNYEFAFMAPEALEAAELYTAHPEWYPEDGLRYANQRLSMKILPEYDAQYKKIIANVRPYVDEMYQSWVLGTRDFDSTYPEFCAELEKRGIQEAIDIVQKSYDAAK